MQKWLIDFRPRYLANGSITIQVKDLEKIPESEWDGFSFKSWSISHVFDKEKNYQHTLVNWYKLSSSS